jgi:hypothetical protein
MRQLTLILSDLYLPDDVEVAEAHQSRSSTVELPALSELLRFSNPPVRISDWRRWLLAATNPPIGDWPIAAFCAHGQVDRSDLASTWLATPVALEARLDHVRLIDRGLLRLDPSERSSCREEFVAVFGSQYRLHEAGERGFFLTGVAPVILPTADPARLIGADIGPALPVGESGDLRRLWTEIEMWLHGAKFNATRERARRPRVSALWLWGGGAVREPMVMPPPSNTVAYYGGDFLIAALCGLAGSGQRSVPVGYSALEPDAAHSVVEFAALTGTVHESLEVLDTHWFAPVRAALMSGEIQQVDLVANDLHFRLGERSHFRFWRRRRNWLARFAAAGKVTKA